jgi:glycosyltransferase involved in cell wall biosynthesis
MAIAHEWFSSHGGSEAVARQMAASFPGCDVYTLWVEGGARTPEGIRESWLSRTPLRRSKAAALPVMPLAWRTTSRQRYDVLLSSSHAFAHHFRTPKPHGRRQFRLAYVHTPARYVWTSDLDARGRTPWATMAAAVLRPIDAASARRLDAVAANSSEVAARIRRFWGREATVIHPPVDVDFFRPPRPQDYRLELPRNFVLGASRWIPYKRLDLVMEAGRASGRPVVIAGAGPEEVALRRRASQMPAGAVTFVASPTAQQLRELYARADVYCFPAHEDFGMMPLEAQACGTPVVALRRGGSLETVVDGVTGELVDTPDPRAFAAAFDRAAVRRDADCVAWAQQFSPEVFRDRLVAWVRASTENTLGN